MIWLGIDFIKKTLGLGMSKHRSRRAVVIPETPEGSHHTPGGPFHPRIHPEIYSSQKECPVSLNPTTVAKCKRKKGKNERDGRTKRPKEENVDRPRVKDKWMD